MNDFDTLTVLDIDSHQVRLASLWAERQVVLAFLRHFGWMFARQQAAALMKVKPVLDRSAVGLVAVGSGSPASARQFVQAVEFSGEMVVDPGLKTYRAFGLKRGLLKTLGPSAIFKGIGALKNGFRQGSTAGDLWQQGGLFVIGPGGNLAFAHRDRFAGDHADLLQAIAALNLKTDDR